MHNAEGHSGCDHSEFSTIRNQFGQSLSVLFDSFNGAPGELAAIYSIQEFANLTMQFAKAGNSISSDRIVEALLFDEGRKGVQFGERHWR